ncbi:helix-turn-helix transcriptional regulator [Ligilactobacillus agilis]|uniref:helix-turn-helix domain-containing protein n=2 Tax=Ligilactobacillus agilis TaxID=1601 RepID=UPI00191F3249|nr:helix-turn-helix transcriptional regulator [Ligilactobacillus agilis]MBL1056990.1 helix-turn-helix transcriptional regulator [Ligilactobacillus agilis]
MKRSRMREERIKKGLTYKELASIVGLSAVYIRKIENGERTPSLATAAKLSSFFGLSVKTLYPDIFLGKNDTLGIK